MVNKKSKYPSPLQSKFEYLEFVKFIEKATGWEREVHPGSFYSKNGIEGITDAPIYVYLLEYVDVTFDPGEKHVGERALIYVGDKNFIQSMDLDLDKEILLDSNFIRKLVVSNPELWWLFVASCSENCRIILDGESQNLVLSAYKMPCVYGYINITPSLHSSRVHKLSEIFENEYIYRRKLSDNNYVIIGNGVSIPFGSDPWNELSDYLFGYLKPQYLENGTLVKKAIGDNNYSSTSISKTIITPSKYDDALYACIYRKYESSMHSGNTLIRAIALAKKANKNLKLISYNYDEFLETDYNDYCDPSDVMRSVCSAREDATTEEPKVKHVHGVIPLDGTAKKGVVLTQEEYFRTYKNENWVVRTQEMALKGNCLYVGSSMSDLFQMSIIDRIRDAHYKNSYEFLFTYPWNCYALLCLKGLSARDIAAIYTYYLNKGVKVIYVEDFNLLSSKFSDLMA